MPDVPTIAFPLRVVNGQLLEVEQGQAADVAGQVTILVHTPPGWLGLDEDDPAREFGLADQAHQAGGPDTAVIEEQIAAHIPDLDVAVDSHFDEVNQALARVGVKLGAS